MVVSTPTLKTISLLAAWVLLLPFAVYLYLAVAIFWLLPLAGLVLIHRNSWEPQTLRMLSSAITAFVCYTLFAVVLSIAYWEVGQDIIDLPPWLTRAVWSSGGSWIALFLGLAAGLRWPNRLLVPVLPWQSRPKFRIHANIPVIMLLALVGGFLVGLWDAWLYLLRWFGWGFDGGLSLVMGHLGLLGADLVVVGSSVVILVEWSVIRPTVTPQVRRTILIGLAGLLVMILTRQLLSGLATAVLTWGIAPDPLSFASIARLLTATSMSGALLGWLGLTLGLWAALRWPNRLLLPASMSGGTQRIRLTKNLLAIATYLLLALAVFWSISFAMIFSIWS